MQETLFGKAFDTVKVLRKARPECNVFNDGFEEPLHVAAQRRHLNIFRLLLETHAEVTADIEPLRIVAGTRDIDAARLLVARGASFNAGNPLGVAAIRGHYDFVQYLLGAGAGENSHEGSC